MGCRMDQESIVASDLSQQILDDSGYSSRKYWALFGYWVLSMSGYLACAKWSSLAGQYPALLGALSAGLVGYYGVNSAHTYMAAKQANTGTKP
jgi:hypothetical protein